MSTAMAGSSGFATARRVNRSLTAAAEKQALTWMAERAPAWLTSDQLTMLGLVAQFGAGVFYGLARLNKYWLLGVIACIVLNWLGDSLDGTLARVRNQQRPRYGFYVDHMVDVLGATAMMCGLGALAGGDCDAGRVSAALSGELPGDVYARLLSDVTGDLWADGDSDSADRRECGVAA
jgi:hypothetical protein